MPFTPSKIKDMNFLLSVPPRFWFTAVWLTSDTLLTRVAWTESKVDPPQLLFILRLQLPNAWRFSCSNTSYRHHNENVPLSSGRRRVLCSWNGTGGLFGKCAYQPQKQKNLWRRWRKLVGQRNESRTDMSWKATLRGRNRCSKNQHKKRQIIVYKYTQRQRRGFLETCPVGWWNYLNCDAYIVVKYGGGGIMLWTGDCPSPNRWTLHLKMSGKS